MAPRPSGAKEEKAPSAFSPNGYGVCQRTPPLFSSLWGRGALLSVLWLPLPCPYQPGTQVPRPSRPTMPVWGAASGSWYSSFPLSRKGLNWEFSEQKCGRLGKASSPIFFVCPSFCPQVQSLSFQQQLLATPWAGGTHTLVAQPDLKKGPPRLRKPAQDHLGGECWGPWYLELRIEGTPCLVERKTQPEEGPTRGFLLTCEGGTAQHTHVPPRTHTDAHPCT